MAIRHAANAPGASPTPHAPPPHRLRANGALGLAIGIALLAIVFAIAVAMERTMHGFPPGTF